MNRKTIILLISLLSLSCFAQNINSDPEQNINDQNSRMRYDFGTRTAQLFVDLFKIDNTNYLNDYTKVVMFRNGNLVDTLYLKNEYYNDGNSSYYLYFYNFSQNNCDKISSLILKNIKNIDVKSFNSRMKQFIKLFKSDFNNFLYSKIEVNKNELIMTNSDKSESFYLNFDNQGRIIKGRKLIKYTTDYSSGQFGDSYTYYYDKSNNITKKETFAYVDDNITKIDYSIVEVYNKSGKITQKIEKKYNYSSDKNLKIQETEDSYLYDSNNNLKEKKLIFNSSSKYYSFKIDYIKNVIKVNKTFNNNANTQEVYEFQLLK